MTSLKAPRGSSQARPCNGSSSPFLIPCPLEVAQAGDLSPAWRWVSREPEMCPSAKAGRFQQPPAPALAAPSPAFLPELRIPRAGDGGGTVGAASSLGLQGHHWKDHSLAADMGLWARPSTRQMTNALPLNPHHSPILQTRTLRVRLGKVPPTPSSSRPLPQPFHHGGWLPHPGAHHFAPFLKSCPI